MGVSEGSSTWSERLAVRMRRMTGPCLLGDGKEMIDSFKVAGLDVLAGFVDGLFNGLLDAVDRLGHRARYFDLFGDFFVGPIDAGGVGEKIEGSSESSRRNLATATACAGSEQQRVLRRLAGIGDNGRRPRRELPLRLPL